MQFLSEILPKLRANTQVSVDDYRKKAKEFFILLGNKCQEIERLLTKLSEKTNPTPREENELNLMRISLRLNESFNALILISLYAINDLQEYVDALEKHASEHDETFNKLLERADEIAERNRGKPPATSMIS